MNIQKVEEFIEQCKGLNALVIGETITDRFMTVAYEGYSMKSFCPVFKVEDEDLPSQDGGALAIANHLKNFVRNVDLISNPKEEIVKTRLVDLNGRAKHVEINRINVTPYDLKPDDYSGYDLIIVADFGHGFCRDLNGLKDFHLMCQTNSNNFGFNRLSKWKNYQKKSVCIDLREASLQLNSKVSEWNEATIEELYNYEVLSDELFVTLGKNGASHYDGQTMNRVSNFKTEIVDTIGAGDTFFSFASAASTLGLSPNEKLIIPSLAASLSTTWLCNEKSVTPDELLNHARKHL